MPGWLDVWRSFWSRSGHERARLLRTAWHSVRQHGVGLTANRMRRSAAFAADRDAENARYARWCLAHTPDDAALGQMKAVAAGFPYQPLVSIITPVYNTDRRWLHACAASVVAQAYPHWEWHVANDGSDDPRTLDALAELTTLDARIKLHHLPVNGGISAASNVALGAATGDYVGLLDHDDALLPHALVRVVEHLNRYETRPDIVYTDEDKLEPDGSRADAYFKPDWSPDLFLSNMYACHFLVVRRALMTEVGGFRSAFDFSQDYDLVLRLIERANRAQSQINTVREQIEQIVRAGDAQQRHPEQAAIERLEKQIADVERALAARQETLIAPERLPALLRDIVGRSKGVELDSVRVLPGAAVRSAAGATGLYRHGVEIALKGSYFDLLRYLEELEKRGAALLWGAVELQVDDYPEVKLRIVIQTLSRNASLLAI